MIRRVAVWFGLLGPAWSRFRRAAGWKGFLLALLVLGVKWMLIEDYGGEVPYKDQWDAEGDRLYAPWLSGESASRGVWSPHNEHRIVATQLFNLALLELNGRQWDPRLQMTAAALVQAAWFGVLGAWLARRLAPRWHAVALGALAVLGAVPFGYENSLWGFQSQFYFMALFTLLAATALLFSPARSWRWWLGWPSAALAVVSFGSASLAGTGLLGVIAVRAWRHRALSLRDGFVALGGAALVVAGVLLRAEVASHAEFAAKAWDSFAATVLRLGAWPAITQLWAAPLVWAPLAWVLYRFALRREPLGRVTELGLFLALGGAAQIAALGVFRGEALALGLPTSRYHDVLAVGVAGNSAVLLGLLASARDARARAVRGVMFTAWTAGVALGLFQLDRLVQGGPLPAWRKSAQEQAAHQRAYLQTGDRAILAGKSPDTIGYPVPERLAQLLKHPVLRPALPPALQDGSPDFVFAAASGFRRGGWDQRLLAAPPYPVWANSGAPRGTVARSEPFEITRPGVVFLYAVSGERGLVEFRFLSASGELRHTLRAYGAGAAGWLSARFELPRGTTILEIHDGRPGGWVAVAPPRAMAGGGMWARDWTARGGAVCSVAGVALALLLWLPHWHRPPVRRWRTRSGSTP